MAAKVEEVYPVEVLMHFSAPNEWPAQTRSQKGNSRDVFGEGSANILVNFGRSPLWFEFSSSYNRANRSAGIRAAFEQINLECCSAGPTLLPRHLGTECQHFTRTLRRNRQIYGQTTHTVTEPKKLPKVALQNTNHRQYTKKDKQVGRKVSQTIAANIDSSPALVLVEMLGKPQLPQQFVGPEDKCPHSEAEAAVSAAESCDYDGVSGIGRNGVGNDFGGSTGAVDELGRMSGQPCRRGKGGIWFVVVVRVNSVYRHNRNRRTASPRQRGNGGRGLERQSRERGRMRNGAGGAHRDAEKGESRSRHQMETSRRGTRLEMSQRGSQRMGEGRKTNMDMYD
ncbi:hypothetical protein R3P38DRAFT_2804762 [Favolaschia claudopus]|uniref:Inositol-pentakisphosphate 2-kinase n=1 Tax=Favolaschia claudopus TaxID=2862362 RepID=A0AAV9ZP88_9AGAR